MSTTSKEQKVKVGFLPERATKNTYKFTEIDVADEDLAIGSLYVQKSTLSKLGFNEATHSLEVTLKVVPR